MEEQENLNFYRRFNSHHFNNKSYIKSNSFDHKFLLESHNKHMLDRFYHLTEIDPEDDKINHNQHLVVIYKIKEDKTVSSLGFNSSTRVNVSNTGEIQSLGNLKFDPEEENDTGRTDNSVIDGIWDHEILSNVGSSTLEGLLKENRMSNLPQYETSSLRIVKWILKSNNSG